MNIFGGEYLCTFINLSIRLHHKHLSLLSLTQRRTPSGRWQPHPHLQLPMQRAGSFWLCSNVDMYFSLTIVARMIALHSTINSSLYDRHGSPCETEGVKTVFHSIRACSDPASVFRDADSCAEKQELRGPFVIRNVVCLCVCVRQST